MVNMDIIEKFALGEIELSDLVTESKLCEKEFAYRYADIGYNQFNRIRRGAVKLTPNRREIIAYNMFKERLKIINQK